LHEVLFLKRPDGTINLVECAQRVFSALGLNDHEERFSSNHPPDDHYYIARATNGAVEVCDADDDDLPQYKYWVVLTDWKHAESGQTMQSTNPMVVAASLANSGLEVFVPSAGWALVGWDGTGEHFLPAAQIPRTASDA
jgi:hypothetical protein